MEIERAFGPGSGEPGAAKDAGWPVGTWGGPVHEYTPKGGFSPVSVYCIISKCVTLLY